MTTSIQRLTQRIRLDRTLWETIRCTLGWHVMARWEIREFTGSRKEGRKEVEFSIWANVHEAICCGKSEIERLI